jgi:sterol desaturase/sphingolipid hydroxylase (fatty acid hydroxylase superfamily)
MLYTSLLANERLFFTAFLTLSHSFPVVLHQLFLFYIGYMNYYSDRKVQQKSLDKELVKKCIMNFFLNHFIVTPIGLWYIGYPLYLSYSHQAISFDNIPSLHTLIFHIIICMLVEDAMFYWSHRLLHVPMLYKRIHKRHHEFKVLTGCSIASEYTHPLESVLGNILPLITGPILIQCHFFTLCVWIAFRMWKTCDAHSGYDFTWSPFGLCFPLNHVSRHDFHHETGLGSYGSFFLIWDTICGTDRDYNIHIEKRKAK